MKKSMLALLTAMALCFSLCTAAAAAEPTPPERFEAITAPVICENWTTDAVSPNPTEDTVITLDTPTRIEGILNWHWDGKDKDAAGQTISLVDTVSSAVYGPWPVVCVPDDGGWYAFPDTVLPAGSYKLTDSDPATWDKYQEKGMTKIKGSEVDLWSSYAAPAFACGAGTVGDPFQIATPEQLAKLARDVNYGGNGYNGKYFVLTADIDLAGHLWDPIGYGQDRSFAADLDGQNHVVKNMTIKAGTVNSQNLGLFGEICGYGAGDLRNLGLGNARIEIDRQKTYTKAGLLAGDYSTYEKDMTNCFARGEIIATVELTENDRLGGLIGSGSSIHMENCYFTGKISQPTDAAMLGGLMGRLYSIDDHPAEISNSYAAAQFSPRGAGLFWRNTGRYSGYCTLKNTYYDKSDSAHITTDSGNFSQDWYTSANGTGLSGAEMMTRHMAGVLNHHSGNTVWAQSPVLNGGYPVLNRFHAELTDTALAELILRKGSSEAEVTADTILTAKGMEEQKPYLVHVLDGNGRILPDAAVTWTVEGSDTVTVDQTGLVAVAADAPEQACTVRVTSQTVPAVTKSFPLTVQPTDTPLWTDNLEPAPAFPFSGGSGSEASPYLIGSVRDLAQLAANVNGGVEYGYNHFRLTQNLDLSGKFWVPIGRTSRTLEGVFDGDGHVISGMKLRASLLPVKDNRQYLGFLGYSNMRIENLGMEGPELVLDRACNGYAGVLGGSLNSVYRCYVNNAAITITEAFRETPFQIGGLAYHLNAYAESCWFRGIIDDRSGKTDTPIGVLALTISNGSAINSWSDAVIHTKSTEVRNPGSFYTVDGLPQGSYDPSRSGIRTPAQLKSALAAMELNENRGDFHPWVWQEAVNGGYPQLAVFCGELEEKTASHLWLRKGGYDVTEDTIVTRQSENAIRKELTAHVADQYGRPMSGQSVAWTVAPANAGVAIDAADGTVTVTPEAVAGDYTITATCGAGTDTVTLHVIRPDPDKGLWSDGLTANPDCTFSGGDGTEAAPYLISSETDLAQLAVNVNAGTNYNEKHFRLTRDLDLGGNYWVPIGGRAYIGVYGYYRSDWIYTFWGSFDGDFHTVDHMEILYDVLWDRLGEDYRQSFSYAGLFGKIRGNDNCVKNLALKNASAAVYDWGKGFYAQGFKEDKKEETGVGLLAGSVYGAFADSTYVDRCSAEGTVTVGAYARGVGGLAGLSEGGRIQNTFFKGSINQGPGYTVGGIAGGGNCYDYHGSTHHSFSAADIHSRATVYGVFSYAAGTCAYDSTLLDPDSIRSSRFEPCREQAMTTEELSSYNGLGVLSGTASRAWAWDGKENGGCPYLLGFESVKPVLWTDGVTADENTVFAGGSGTAESPYEINTPEQLALLARNVNTGTVADGYQGRFFKLTADLDLAGKYWVPIGINDQNFKGAFDGGFHTISNMTIKASTVPDFRRIGLFGYSSPSTFEGVGIRDLLLTGATVEVDQPGVTHVGSLLGSGSVPLTRCGAEGIITARFDVTNLGGLMGWSSNQLRSCFFRGQISAKGGSYHGGLLGCRSSNNRAYNCYVSATISSTASNVCPVSETCETSFYDRTLNPAPAAVGSGTVQGKTTEELKHPDMWRLLNGPGGNVDSSGSEDANLYRSCRNWAQKADLNDGFPILRGVLRETYDLWTAHAAESFAGGDGLTAATAYEIATPEQLAKLARDVNTGTAADGYLDRFFKVTADLDLKGKLWEPIGLSEKRFKGSFDGGLHTISNMTIRDHALPEHRHLGLFGCANPASGSEGAGLRNILLTGVDIRAELPGNCWVGSLAGRIYYTSVERCGAEGTVTALSYVTNLGGLVGFTEGVHDSCFFRGTVNGGAGQYHAGLIGRNDRFTLSDSYAAASFTSQASSRSPVTYYYINNCYYDSTLCPVTAENGLSASNAVGRTTEEMKTYAFAIALNGKEGNAWTSTGTDCPMLSGGMAPTAEMPAGITARVNTGLSDVVLPNPEGNTPGVWVWITPEQSVGSSTGDKPFAAMFLPADSRFAPVRASIPVTVQAPPSMTVTDNPATPKLEVTIENAETGWCLAAVYSPEGQLLFCSWNEVTAGNSSLAIGLGGYDVGEGRTIRVFLLNGSFLPQTAAAMP